MKRALVTTAFPYLNGKLHQGHKYCYYIYQAVSKILKNNNYDTIKPFSFHTTGISLVSRPARYIEDLTIPFEIRREISNNNWTPLLDYYQKDLLVKFKTAGIEISKDYLEYTHDSSRYLIFLDSCFKKLKNYVSKNTHKLIYCNNCQSVLGQHDRATGESAIIVESTSSNLEGYYRIPNTNDYLSEKVICKCSSEGVVREVEDWFIDYHKLVPRELFLKNIENLTEDLKKVLLNKYDSLRSWCITRDKGLGPRFLFDFKKILEPLSDSTLFPIYYLLKDYEKPTIDQILKVNPCYLENHYHIVGKDLVENHLLFMILWEIFFLGRKVTTFIVTGHLLLGGEKMSKSKGNIIPFEEKHFTLEEAFWSNNGYKDFSRPLSIPTTLSDNNKKTAFSKNLFTDRNTTFHKLKNRIINKTASFKSFSFENLKLVLDSEIDESFNHNEGKIKELKDKIFFFSRTGKKIKKIIIPAFYFSYLGCSLGHIKKNLKNIFNTRVVRKITNKPFIVLV